MRRAEGEAIQPTNRRKIGKLLELDQKGGSRAELIRAVLKLGTCIHSHPYSTNAGSYIHRNVHIKSDSSTAYAYPVAENCPLTT